MGAGRRDSGPNYQSSWNRCHGYQPGHPRVISPVACPPPVDFAGNPSRNSKLAQLSKFYVFTTKSQSRCVKNRPVPSQWLAKERKHTVQAGRAHASSDIAASGRPAAMGQLFPACTGMSGYSRRGRGASGPPLVISKYSPASARTSSIAPLCPPAPPALGREFRFQKAMMALAPAEIPPISGVRSLS